LFRKEKLAQEIRDHNFIQWLTVQATDSQKTTKKTIFLVFLLVKDPME